MDTVPRGLWTAGTHPSRDPGTVSGMGLHTSYVGHVAVTPPLAPGEVELVRALNETRRWDAPGGALRTASHPSDDEPAEHCSAEVADAYNRPAPGAPGLWCPWTACERGHCLHWDGVEKPYRGEEWLRWTVDTLLRPGAVVAGTAFASRHGLSCDHQLAGVLVGERHETSELFALDVSGNRVTRRLLLPGVVAGVVGVAAHRGDAAVADDRRARLSARAERYRRALVEDSAVRR